MEFDRDDHERVMRQAEKLVTYGMQPPDMVPDWQARGEVIATIVAHSDRGDGWCGGEHEGVPPVAHKCPVREWHLTVLERMKR